MNPRFWKGRRVFLTGHTGFKGSWLSLWLQSIGAEVTGYALPPADGESLFMIGRVGDGMRSVFADIRDIEHLHREMQIAAPEVVIHMAAQALVRESYVSPLETYSTNVMGTAHVLDGARHVPTARAVISVTTDKCYENREWPWGYREVDSLGGYDPYSNSKACAELVTAAYRASFFNPARYAEHRVALASARAGNVIGGGDWARDRLIPDLLSAMTHGEPVRIRSPHAVRPWQHVLEPLSGYLSLAEALSGDDGASYADAWNFGPSDEDARSVQWIVEQMVSRWGEQIRWELDRDPQPHEANYLKLDCSKARARLGWRPRWSLAAALEAIVFWHKAYLTGADMRATTLAQIADFESGKTI